MAATTQSKQKQSNAANKVEYTKDSFHRGGFEIVQPKDGHRAGLDCLLLGASLPKNPVGMLADLGAGCGAAGLAALNLSRDIDLVGIELNDIMFNFLQRSIDLPSNARFKSRVKTRQADVTKSGTARLEQGLEDNAFDYVIMNPPYNTENHRPPADSLKAEAYMMGDGGLDAWFRTAAAILKPGGTFSLVYRTENIASILACSQGRFGNLELMPIHSKANEVAKRVLVRSVRGSRGPLTILPGFVIHNQDGSFTPQAEAIFDGEKQLAFLPN
jgi:tRNA1(Val) A37 N6-methylase TrmN6